MPCKKGFSHSANTALLQEAAGAQAIFPSYRFGKSRSRGGTGHYGHHGKGHRCACFLTCLRTAIVPNQAKFHPHAGVPLLEELMGLSVPDASARTVIILGRAAVALAIGALTLGALHGRLTAIERQRSDFRPVISTLASMVKPILVLLPYYAIAYFATVISALAQVAATKMRPDFDLLTRGNSATVVRALCKITQLLQDTTELVLIVGVAWTATRLKKRAISAIQLHVMRNGENEAPSLSRLMEGADTALNWIIWVVASLTALTAYGVDPSPLLASLGASSLIIGLAAQSILANIVSGVALYTGSSFRVGDHVQFLNTGGGKVVEGCIQVIGPSRLVVRDDTGALIYINNSDAAKLIVRNVSQAVAVIP